MKGRSVKQGLWSLIGGMALVCMLFSAAYAVPKTLSYQGYLTDKDGNAVNETVKMTFTLYNAASGGASLWSEIHGSVSVTKGVFNVVFGETDTRLSDALSDNQECYLGISVGADAEMTPRRKLTSTAYSLKAAEAETLTGGIDASKIPDNTIDITKLKLNNGVLEVSGNVKATKFIGDGSLLTDLDWSNIKNKPDNPEESDPVWTAVSANYLTKSDLGKTTDAGSSGALQVGVFDAFDNSTATNVQGVLKDLDTAVSNIAKSGETPRCRVRLVANKTISATWADLVWDVEDYDVGNCWTSGSTTGARFVAPENGLYSLQGVFSITPYNYSPLISIYYYNNNKEYLGHWMGAYTPVQVSLQQPMVAGASLVIEIKSYNAYTPATLEGGTPGQDVKLSFMTFAKMN